MENKGIKKGIVIISRNIYDEVYKIVSKIPKGKVTTYGTIAKQLKISPRIVGRALHQNPDPKNIPCHRVVDRTGRIAESYAFGGWKKQREKLIAEGIKFKNDLYIKIIDVR